MDGERKSLFRICRAGEQNRRPRERRECLAGKETNGRAERRSLTKKKKKKNSFPPATTTTTAVAAASSSAAAAAEASSSSSWVPVLRPEDLPKGSRREVRVGGRPVLLFWYRNQVGFFLSLSFFSLEYFLLRPGGFSWREREGREERREPHFLTHLSPPSPNPAPPRQKKKKKNGRTKQIYAIEARSPAEGAYSEGFADAKLTQDFCIECPTTKTLFSLKTGEIVAWYPTNPILRALTPRDTCRPLDIFPVRVTQEAISVDASGPSGSAASGSAVPSTRGGADSSIDRNNVYAISPKTYTSDDDFYAPSKAAGGASSSSGGADIGATAATITSVVAVVATGAAGTAVAIYKDLGAPAIVAVWIAVGAATFAYSRSGKE